jgi:hypothetical protein
LQSALYVYINFTNFKRNENEKKETLAHNDRAKIESRMNMRGGFQKSGMNERNELKNFKIIKRVEEEEEVKPR